MDTFAALGRMSISLVAVLGLLWLISRWLRRSKAGKVATAGEITVLTRTAVGHKSGVAVVKVGGTERMVRAAAQRFAGQSQETVIEQQTSEVLVGVLRTIAGTLTVESILYERQDFSKEVKDIAVPMLAERAGTVTAIKVTVGDVVQDGDVLVVLD